MYAHNVNRHLYRQDGSFWDNEPAAPQESPRYTKPQQLELDLELAS